MSTPMTEKEQYSFPAFTSSSAQPAQHQTGHRRLSSDEDGTLDGEAVEHDRNYLRVTTSYEDGGDFLDRRDHSRSPLSPSMAREEERRLDDDLEMLRAERVISNAERTEESMGRTKSLARSRSRTNAEPVDDFDVGTTPIHEKNKIYQPPANPTTSLAKLFKRIHSSSWLLRYFIYITPVVLILLIPTLLGLLVFDRASVGGVRLFWFGIWLEIVWLTLWAGRILAKCIPWPMGLISSLFTNNSKKWRDLGKALEVPATLFFWWLAIEVSFLPTMKNHHLDGTKKTRPWENNMNKVIISFFIGFCLNFFEKIIIQLIAISFHLRTYADRIDINKFQISSLVKLYIYSKEKIAMEDSEFEAQNQTGPSSGQRTPMLYVKQAQKNARQVFTKVGDVAGKVAGDFTGKAVTNSNHPHQVVLQLLHSTSGSQVLARRLYRTFVPEDSETVFSDDLKMAFDNDDEASAAFTMFDKDLNGDISMEELEAVCVEIGRERKAITASLKDLDSVVSKLDDVFLFIVFVITILIFISLISSSAATAITSAGSVVLALSWLFSATAQEFLQSIVFVFIKHPFDVGDRVTVYGNTGALGRGDDYFVKEISLLFTEFKKMEGHVVQAPNSYLNTLFILNQRRSGGLAEAVPVTIKFGTTLEQIETLRSRLLEFVTNEKREYQKNILTELREVYEAYSITLNVVFFYKSNWQNELLRLQRRNKFICALMVTMQELGIEGPRMRLAGAAQDFPMYLHGAYPQSQQQFQPDSRDPGSDNEGPGPRFGSLARDGVQSRDSDKPINNHPSILRTRASTRKRGESLSGMSKRVDFSLGMSAISSGADFGDVYEDRKPRVPLPSTSPAPRNSNSRDGRPSHDTDGGSLTHTTSQNSQIGKVTSGTSNRTHKNRFFSRNRSKLGAADEGTSLDDLERGFPMAEMPDIPEASGANSANFLEQERILEGGRGRPRRGTAGEYEGGRIDPRTGLVSSQAVAQDSALERGELPMTAPKRAMTDFQRN
ncbi:mechanosensitive ion channel family [Phlyctema vagabunda]|uniref:Mechanosensitive ion channel protein n=1 Tax=Phlyctema vagabunda TaxID=108571 RepID=A0ABR4P5W8_9HELO